MKRPFQIKFLNVGEVRMGSPYNSCDIELIGTDIKLPNFGWQDKSAWTSDSKNLVLVKWNFDKNEPSFNLYIINTITEQILISEKILGLPNSISISNGIVKYNKFLYDKAKSVPGQYLCCNYDEEFKFDF